MKKRKIYYLSITFLFVFLITSTSVLASPNESSNYTHLVISPNDDKVAVYEEENENSKVNTYVPINTEVNLIDQLELFSHVEYTDTQTGEIVHGFVKNENLKLKDGSSSTNDVNQQKESDLENQKDPEPTQENSEATENINLTDKGNKKKKDNVVKEEASNESKATSTKSNLNQTTLNGIAIKSPTNVYVAYSTDSEVLKSYNQGSILKFKSFTSDWYQVTVYVNGKPTTGYIRASDVEKIPDSQKDLKGIALKQPTRVYQKPSSNSKVLKSYDQGSVLKYKSFISGWYQATVYVNGKPTTGYIRASDVEKFPDSQKDLKGIALKQPTRIYQTPSSNSKVLKSYDQGSVLKYKSFIPGWYQVTVYVNGKPTTGYIRASDVEKFPVSQKDLKGIALKQPTRIYQTPSSNSKVLKSYDQGSVLKYKSFISGWYQATVYVNGKPTTGYIRASDVEKFPDSQKDLKGIALKQPTHIYQTPSSNSKVLKSYDQGSVLKYKSFISGWYQATVYVNGKPTTGYIRASDVEKFPDSQKDLKGIALKQPTRIYQTPSSNSKVLKSYDQGSVLKYKSFISGWYQATVYVNGKPTTGYIRASDVHKSDTSKAYEGFVLQHNTKVYSKASTNSKVLKSYAKGSYVKYKSFIPNWYQATVYINGKPTIGYFNKNDLIGIDSKNPKSLRAIGIKNIINVYNSTTGNNVIKTYPEGNILKVRTYSKDWYQATVYVNRKAYTGYISVKDLEIISPNQQDKTGYAIGIPTNIYSTTSKKSKVLKNYNYGSKLKFKTFSNDWYEAKVYINGKPFVGYIHADDVSSNSVINKTKYNLTMNQALEMQMKVGPQTDQPYAYVSKSYIDKSGNVTADVLNVRSGPGITYKSIGKLYKDTKVKILKETGSWYTIQYVSNQWVYAHADDVRYYLDPTNFQSDPIQQYQFLDLSKPSGASVQVLNKFLKGKGILDGLGKYFLDASRKNGINDLYLVSHALLETGNGSSVLANGVKHKGVTVYNMFGIGANDGCAIECGAQRAYKEGWTTPSKAVVGGAKFIANQYIKDGRNTLYKMRWNPASMEKHKEASYQYATDIGWASKQIYTMYNLYQEIGSYILYLDIPTYKS
ncbi:N-acetylglucosaminidase [Virgibacillus pantothenticus]|uniref:N-acetylglucosaminidase n=1 Tax=Virgibacillus pantothenticus TaxID=1473 RepID=UPI001115A47A|nr:N-acetylglucosaminidase [Virgibacillus pantothenticus]